MENNYLKANAFPEKEKSILFDKKGLFYNFVAERTEEIEKLHNSVNCQDLIYHLKSPTKDIAFNNFIDAETLFDDIKSKK